MLARIKSLVKNSKLIYKVYSVCGSMLLRFVGIFVKTDPNLVLFTSYGGRKYDDSPRVVYEYLQRDPVSADHKYVWAFTEPEKYPEVPNKVRIDTPRFYLTALRAGYWMTNSSMSRGLDFKKKKTKNVLFTHALVALKRFGADVVNSREIFVSTASEKYDVVFVEGKYDTSILSKVWKLDESVFRATGLPRNDDLVGVSPEEKAALKQKLGIPQDKKVIMYAPTFRDDSRGADGSNALSIPIDFGRWKQALGDEYVLMVSAHYVVSQLLDDLPDDGFVINVVGYPKLNELLKVADILISDYSSIVFDYALLERPILGYCYDCDDYLSKRGSYVDLQEFFCDGVIRDEDALLDVIVNMDYDAQCRFTREHIKEKYVAAYGNATKTAVDLIFTK